MTRTAPSALRKLPSVDEVMRSAPAAVAVERFGRPAVVNAVRRTLGELRVNGVVPAGPDAVMASADAYLSSQAMPSLRPVFNLTGTVLHTNLGRALLAEAAVEAAVAAMRSAVALEYDVASGR